MQQLRLSMATILLFVVILGTIQPVSALHFEFSYFETDQLSYEIGETINMAASMIADFSEEGWCYVSFSIITDQGLVFDDGFFISPSPDPQLITSTYTILPEHVSPYPEPIVAQISLNVELFDKYYQGINEMIEVNITRGHVQVQPKAPLKIQTNENATLSFGISSAFNESIPFANESILIEIHDSTNSLIFSNTTKTNSSGELFQKWFPVTFSPAQYSVRITGNETNDFLSFSEAFSLLVTAEPSSVTILDSVESLYCQTQSGSSFESAHIVVQHLDNSGDPISDSNVTWNTVFANGTMTPSIVGQYEGTIPFNVSPGQYQINITATHYNYQEAITSFSVSVLPRYHNISAITHQVLSSNILMINLILEDWLTGEAIESISVNVTIAHEEWFHSIETITNSTGQTSCCIPIPENVSGFCIIQVTAKSSLYYSSTNITIPVEILFEPIIRIHSASPFIRTQPASMNISIEDPFGLRVTNISVKIADFEGTLLATGYANSLGFIVLGWTIDDAIPIGNQDFTITVLPNTRFAAEMSSNFEAYVTYPLWITTSETSWIFTCGSTSNVNITAYSEYGVTDTVIVQFRFTTGELVKQTELLLETPTIILFDIPANISKGLHIIEVELLHANYSLVQSISIETTILVPITSEVIHPIAFYQEYFQFEVIVLDDTFQPLSSASIQIVERESNLLIAQLNDTSLDLLQSVTLPLWLTPGRYTFDMEISGNYTISIHLELEITIWIRTSIQVVVNTEQDGQQILQSISLEQNHDSEIALIISSGSINSPPPILFNGTTSTEPPETRNTSFTSCPRFSSGTSNLSTVSENCLMTLSGNGHMVRNLRDLKEDLLSLMASSTDREVLPKDITPHSEFSGPLIATSVR